MEDTVLSRIVPTLLEETFERHHGIYTNRGTSLLETLADVTAEEASRPLAGDSGTLAAQVEHTAFYLEVLLRAMAGETVENVDWEAIWAQERTADAAQWDAAKARLERAYRAVQARIADDSPWTEERLYVLAIVAHSAYHLGVIRHAIAVLRHFAVF